jgi:hypothetical protein
LSEFAATRGLKARTLAWWRWRLRQDSEPAAAPPEVRLLPVEVRDDSVREALGALEVQLPGPIVLRFAAGAELSTVVAVVRAAVGAVGC